MVPIPAPGGVHRSPTTRPVWSNHTDTGTDTGVVKVLPPAAEISEVMAWEKTAAAGPVAWVSARLRSTVAR